MLLESLFVHRFRVILGSARIKVAPKLHLIVYSLSKLFLRSLEQLFDKDLHLAVIRSNQVLTLLVLKKICDLSYHAESYEIVRH